MGTKLSIIWLLLFTQMPTTSFAIPVNSTTRLCAIQCSKSGPLGSEEFGVCMGACAGLVTAIGIFGCEPAFAICSTTSLGKQWTEQCLAIHLIICG